MMEYIPLIEERILDLIKALQYGDANGKTAQQLLNEWLDLNFKEINQKLDDALDKLEALEYEVKEYGFGSID